MFEREMLTLLVHNKYELFFMHKIKKHCSNCYLSLPVIDVVIIFKCRFSGDYVLVCNFDLTFALSV